jgi:hypothetical protein
MDSLIIAPTEDSPEVRFTPTSNRLIISGESRPENAGKFYTPVINWIQQFESILYWRKNEGGDKSQIIFEFRLDYFNSTSAKYILDIIFSIKKLIVQKYDVVIEWHYDKRDDDMLDAGKEFSEMVDIPFKVVPY